MGVVVVAGVVVGMVMVVVIMPVMMMVMLMAVRVGGRTPGVPSQERRQPERRDGEARAQGDPGIEALRDDIARGIDGRRPQEIDTRRVGARDDEPENHRMPGGPAR